MLVLVSLSLSACSGGGATAGDGGTLSPTAALGKQLFADTSLSVSGRQACQTCHMPSRAYAAGSALPAPMGGPDFDPDIPGSGLPGFRNAPSLMYASFTPAFFFNGDGPNGGFFRDGRATSLADQAMQPLVTPYEMGGSGHDTPADVLTRLQSSPHRADFEAVFGPDALADPQTALTDIGLAIAAYEKESPEFHPFSSKFDAYQNGTAQLTAQELKGFALFNNPTKGNCAACHVSRSADGVTPALFTDFTYDNIGVPRNTALAVDDDDTTLPYVPADSQDGVHRFYDLGLCGPFRELPGNTGVLCGQFKVPTLRNIALTAPYFHNGEFDTLQKAVGFYVRRDTHPEEWYPAAADGTVTKFDDLPEEDGGQFVVSAGVPGSDAGYAGNVNTEEAPYDRHIGEPARLSPDEINDVVSFLCTLTDGYDPQHPDDYPWPAQCQAAEPH